jgi:hypothetical protein
VKRDRHTHTQQEREKERRHKTDRIYFSFGHCVNVRAFEGFCGWDVVVIDWKRRRQKRRVLMEGQKEQKREK